MTNPPTPVTIDDFDWQSLDGRTITITVKVRGNQAFVIEGSSVKIVDLNEPITDALPFFGPRSTRTGQLTDEQKHALDLLITNGYTAHRAAMLLGVHDSTVSKRKRELLGPAPRRTNAGRKGITAKLTHEQHRMIHELYYMEGHTMSQVAADMQLSQATVSKYLALSLPDAPVIEHEPTALSNGYAEVINETD